LGNRRGCISFVRKELVFYKIKIVRRKGEMARIRVTNDNLEAMKEEKQLPRGFLDALKEGKDKAVEWIKNNKTILITAGLLATAVAAADAATYGRKGVFRRNKHDKDADTIMKNIKEGLRGVMFQMWDKKNYDETIWKLIKPEFKKL
jgi:hypothetical protein